jgi:hypothetical protein
MAQWVVGYYTGLYASMTEIALDLPGPLRRINAGFYMHGNDVTPVPLAPRVTADGDQEVQISDPTTEAGKRAIKIFLAGAPVNHPVIFLFVEIELDYPGTKHDITP